MEIKFEKIDSVYVAEFEITSNCNIHIEREDLGRFIIESRGSKSGKYVPMEEGHYGDKYVIDVDMLGNIYPKYIKITSVSKPTYAEVNFAGEGGGESGNEKVFYFTIDNFTSVNFVDLGRLVSTVKLKLSDSPNAATFGNPGDIVIIRPIELGISGTEFGDIKIAAAFIPELKLFSKEYTGTFNDIANELLGENFLSSITKITKDEYYDLTKL